MEMLSDHARILATEPVRPLSRVEFEHLSRNGFFEDERVELLFGVVVTMPPTSSWHGAGTNAIRRLLEAAIGDRAVVESGSAFAASDESEPVPDVFVVAHGRDPWKSNATSALLVIEVSQSSLRHDRSAKGKLYALADVDEYWIVDLDGGRVEVYRDRDAGEWRTKTTHGRGETISPRAFPDAMIPVSEIVPPVGE